MPSTVETQNHTLFHFFLHHEMQERTVQNFYRCKYRFKQIFDPSDSDRLGDQYTIDAIWFSPRSIEKPFTLTPLPIADLNANALIDFFSTT